MGKLGKYIKKLGSSYESLIEENVCALLPQGENISYLDLGCDDGEKTLSRSKVIGTKKIHAVEVEPSRAEKARKLGIKVVEDNLNIKWSIKSNSIDCLTATEVIEHIIDVDNFISESKRVLKKGAKLILSTENLAAWHNVLALVIGNQPYTGPYISRIYPVGHRPNAAYYKNNMNKTMYPHINVMTTKALSQLLLSYGFRIEKICPVGFYPIPLPFAKIASKVDKYHSSYCVVCAIKK